MPEKTPFFLPITRLGTAIKSLLAVPLCVLASGACAAQGYYPAFAAPDTPAVANGNPLSLEARPSAAGDWWTENVWTNPDRPFLYYNDPSRDRRIGPSIDPDAEDVAPKDAPPDREEQPTRGVRNEDNAEEKAEPPAPRPLTSFKTIEGLRAEGERRLSVAIMDPTEANIESWLEANAFMMQKSAEFAYAWSRGRLAHPEYDWTAAHPTANFAATELSSAAERERHALLKELGGSAGLILVLRADDSLSIPAARTAQAFARANGFPLMTVADDPDAIPEIPGLERAPVPENGISQRLGITMTPTLVLVPDPAHPHPALARLTRPLPFATGVHSVEELGRRLVLLLQPTAPLGNDAVLPGLNARALRASGGEQPRNAANAPSLETLLGLPTRPTPTNLLNPLNAPNVPNTPTGTPLAPIRDNNEKVLR